MVSGVVRCRWWISWVARFSWFHTAFSLPCLPGWIARRFWSIPLLDNSSGTIWHTVKRPCLAKVKWLSRSKDEKLLRLLSFQDGEQLSNQHLPYLLNSSKSSLLGGQTRRIISWHILRPIYWNKKVTLHKPNFALWGGIFCPQRAYRFPRYLVTNLVTNSSLNLVIHQIWWRICHQICHQIWWITALGDQFITKFGDKFSESPNLVMNLGANFVTNLVNRKI